MVESVESRTHTCLPSLQANSSLDCLRLPKFIFVVIFAFFSSTVLFAAPKKQGPVGKIKPKQTVTINVLIFDEAGADAKADVGAVAVNDAATSDVVGAGAVTGAGTKIDSKNVIFTEELTQQIRKEFNVNLNILESGGLETGAEVSKIAGEVENGENSQKSAHIILWKNAGDQYKNACLQQELLDWEKDGLYEKWAPYVQQNFKRAVLKNKFYDSPDRRLHGFAARAGQAGKLLPLSYTWQMNADAYEKAGSPEVKTLSDLQDVFLKMKEAVPFDSQGVENFALYVGSDGFEVVNNLVKAYFGYDNFDFGFYNPDSGDFFDYFSSDGPYLYCLKFLNKLNQTNLLAVKEENKQNVFWNIFEDSADSGVAKKSDGVDADTENSAVPKITVCPTEAHPLVYCQNPYGTGPIWSVNAKNDYSELCLAIINWVCLQNADDGEASRELLPENILPGVEIRKCYPSLYEKVPYNDADSKTAAEEKSSKSKKGTEKTPENDDEKELFQMLKTKTYAAIFAKDDEEYEKIVSAMTEAAQKYDYSKRVEHSRAQSKKRFSAEQLARTTVD